MWNRTDADNQTDEIWSTDFYTTDLVLAACAVCNTALNLCLCALSLAIIRRGYEQGGGARSPHYGLHIFVCQCAAASCVLQLLSAVSNTGYLFVGDDIFSHWLQSELWRYWSPKLFDFSVYVLFNVAHLNFVLLLNVDKLLYILRPLHYHRVMTKGRAYLACALTWAVSAGMSSPSLLYYNDRVAELRRTVIRFALSVICPLTFDLGSALVVAVLLFRIQLRDSRLTRLAYPGVQRRTTGVGCCSRRLAAFSRTFAPILWTCLTTMPYTSTMMYLYFDTDTSDEFDRRWLLEVNTQHFRIFTCVYGAYFTGVPLIIIFNNHPYRKRVRRLFCGRTPRRKSTFTTYSSVPLDEMNTSQVFF